MLEELGEIVHGSEKEREAIRVLREKFEGFETKLHTVTTKEWVIRHQRVLINGKEVGRFAVMPYTKGSAKGKVGREVLALPFPDHPFKVKDYYRIALDQGYEALLLYEDKARRIAVPDPKIPAVSLPFKPEKGDEVEVEVESELRDSTSYNLEVILRDGKEFFLVGAHVDHWLSGYHDNLLAVNSLLNFDVELRNHGLKLAFFSSEEGPRCCTGSMQFPKQGIAFMVSLDALYPDRVVFSTIPELWWLSKHFRLKRVEMPSPFSDSFPFLLSGVPSVLLYNDDLIPFYHSDADLPDRRDGEFAEGVRGGLKAMLMELDEKGVKDLRWTRVMPDYVNLTTQFSY